ncbi:hypothetical protein C8F04DRAFT_1264856 [Mycena alexandri]|uniref:Uncharacterized protein n=1 Tax=Mycena alexandri TaxID=1745969 RepID=A0AAD6WYQ3_9AGAR|nr:hypothetical protein C8F04DRAFT_1264856 [Mycena alexandri]
MAAKESSLTESWNHTPTGTTRLAQLPPQTSLPAPPSLPPSHPRLHAHRAACVRVAAWHLRFATLRTPPRLHLQPAPAPPEMSVEVNTSGSTQHPTPRTSASHCANSAASLNRCLPPTTPRSAQAEKLHTEGVSNGAGRPGTLKPKRSMFASPPPQPIIIYTSNLIWLQCDMHTSAMPARSEHAGHESVLTLTPRAHYAVSRPAAVATTHATRLCPAHTHRPPTSTRGPARTDTRTAVPASTSTRGPAARTHCGRSCAVAILLRSSASNYTATLDLRD